MQESSLASVPDGPESNEHEPPSAGARSSKPATIRLRKEIGDASCEKRGCNSKHGRTNRNDQPVNTPPALRPTIAPCLSIPLEPISPDQSATHCTNGLCGCLTGFWCFGRPVAQPAASGTKRVFMHNRSTGGSGHPIAELDGPEAPTVGVVVDSRSVTVTGSRQGPSLAIG